MTLTDIIDINLLRRFLTNLKNLIPTKVSDLTNDSGFTSNTGTITGITMNGVSKGTSGIVNLGTVLTEHQDISGKANSADLATVATSGSYNDLDDTPTIPAAPGTLNTNNLTAQTVSSSESLSGTIKLHKVAKTGSYSDLNNKPILNDYYPETTTVPNITSVGSASTWNFAMGTGTDEHTLIISGGNGTAPSLGTAKTVATGNLTNAGISQIVPLCTNAFISGGGSSD